MKIAQKLLAITLVLSLVPMLVVGGIGFILSQRILERQIHSQLNNTAKHQLDRINTLNATIDAQLNNLQFKTQLRLLLSKYSTQPSTALQTQLNHSLADILTSTDTYQRAYVTGTSSLVVASTDPKIIGRDLKTNEAYQTGRHTATSNVLFKSSDGEPYQYLAVPLQLNNQALGVLIVEATADQYLVVTKDYSELGQTGESYLVRQANHSGSFYYLDPLRFNPGALLTPAKAAVTSSQDYRHHQVISAVHSVPGTDWKLVTKIDNAEVVAPLLHLRNVLLLLMVITGILSIVIAWYLARFITLPIKYITSVVVKIRGGDLSQRVNIRSKDEIGLLGTAFNEMTTNFVEAQARLTASISSLPFGFAIINFENQIVFSNQALSTLFGRAIPTDLTKSSELLKQMSDGYKPAIDILSTIEQARTKRRAIEKNVEVGPRFYRFFFLPIINQANGQEEVIGNVLIMEDTTEAKSVERSRDEFFSIASHELRTPLTAIRGNIDMLLQYYPELLKDPSVKEMMTDVHASTIRLIAIVNDFLDTSRLEMGKMVFKKTHFNVAELIEQAIREYDVTGSRKKLSLELKPPAKTPPNVYADLERTRQIIINLLGNAIKFTEQGGVTISLEPAKRMLRIGITDTGQGIAAQNQHLLFHKFQQAADSILTRDNSQSTGLGLYISRLIAESMGGKLYLERSELGKGSTFVLELPVADSSNESPRKKAPHVSRR